jgi:hypothetical protein
MNAGETVETAPEPLQAGRIAPAFDLLPPPSRWRADRAWQRWATIALGIWLFASPFMWPHSRQATMNIGMVSILIVIFGVLALYVRWVRWLTALMGAWLIGSALVIRHLVGLTRLHDVAIGAAVLALSLVWTAARPRRGE